MQMDKTELGCLRAIVLFNPGNLRINEHDDDLQRYTSWNLVADSDLDFFVIILMEEQHSKYNLYLPWATKISIKNWSGVTLHIDCWTDLFCFKADKK